MISHEHVVNIDQKGEQLEMFPPCVSVNGFYNHVLGQLYLLSLSALTNFEYS